MPTASIDLASRDVVIGLVTAKGKGDGQATVVVAAQFEDLPAGMLQAAQQQGQDDNSDQGETRVSCQGWVNLVPKSIHINFLNRQDQRVAGQSRHLVHLAMM